MSPVHAVPKYVTDHASDIEKTPSGHRFLLYFQACGNGWSNLREGKREALNAVVSKGEFEEDLVKNLVNRQRAAAVTDSHLMVCARTTAPIATGLGNPHPVENGFAFLSPYGIPYLAGSSVKGVLRKAAEELALFEPDSGWTIPLVWVLFGFEEKSAYIDPVDMHEPMPLQEERKRWRDVFKAWTDSNSSNDVLLSAWLAVIRSQLPKEKQLLANDPALFCMALQDERGRVLRRSIHWQGMLRVWDVYPETRNGLAVDILNPHHKKYYEGTSTSNDSESPEPVFFLTIPPDASCTFICEIPSVVDANRKKVMEAVGDWKTLMRKAFTHAFDWLGFGAKTAVGYGAMRAQDAQSSSAADPSSSGSGISPLSRPAPSVTITGAEIVWEKASVSWNTGNQTLTVRNQASPPEKSEKRLLKPEDRAIVPSELHKKVFERKDPVVLRVTVEKAGNQITIKKMEIPS